MFDAVGGDKNERKISRARGHVNSHPKQTSMVVLFCDYNFKLVALQECICICISRIDRRHPYDVDAKWDLAPM